MFFANAGVHDASFLHSCQLSRLIRCRFFRDSSVSAAAVIAARGTERINPVSCKASSQVVSSANRFRATTRPSDERGMAGIKIDRDTR